MAIVERAPHLLLFDDQDPAWCKGCCGRCKERLTRHASRTEIVSTMQNREDCFLIPLRPNCDFHLPFLDIEHFLAVMALRTNVPPLAKFGDNAFRAHFF